MANSVPNVVLSVTRAQLDYLQLLKRAEGIAKIQAKDTRVHVALQDRAWVSGDSSDPQLTELGVIALRLAEHEAARTAS